MKYASTTEFEKDVTVDLPKHSVVGGQTTITGHYYKGLMATRSLDDSKTWRVTHAKSGYHIGLHYRTRREALTAAKRLADWCDWDRSGEEIGKLGKEVMPGIRAIRDDVFAPLPIYRGE